jgi:trehalose 6-phosphate synthase/phosphatase
VNPAAVAAVFADLPAGRPLLLLLDYDGTLVPFQDEPSRARPDPALLALLDRLAARPDDRVVIVTGRGGEDVRAFFDGRTLDILALHGARYLPGSGAAIDLVDLAAARKAVRRVIAACDAVREIPGVLLEEKGAALSLHTRRCGPEDEAEAARRFRLAAAPLLGDGALGLLEGSRVLELRPAGADKGGGARWLLDRLGEEWHPFYAGDDATDEDAFRALAGVGTTVAVGPARGPSRARFRLGGVGEVRDLLALVAARPRATTSGARDTTRPAPRSS